MDNVLYQDAYDALSEKVDKTLRVVSRIRDELKKDAGKSKDQSAQLLDIAVLQRGQKCDQRFQNTQNLPLSALQTENPCPEREGKNRDHLSFLPQ